MIHIITQNICYVMYDNMNILYLIANVSIQVCHSQSISDSSTTLEYSREGWQHLVCSLHMYGWIGGSITHVGAVLFFVSSAVEIRSSRMVTQEKAYWLLSPLMLPQLSWMVIPWGYHSGGGTQVSTPTWVSWAVTKQSSQSLPSI